MAESERMCARGAATWLRPQICEGMRLALRDVPVNFEGRGLVMSLGWIEGDGPSPEHPNNPHAPPYVGATYKPKRGEVLVVNYCPWCGESVRWDAPPESSLFQQAAAVLSMP